jgi:predicted dehydrogenase
MLQEWIAAGAIGPVRRVQNWSTRPFWPQGIPRPQTSDPVPDGLDWDLWLGPAPERPYSHEYQPFIWRGWYDFGTGALGDMGQYSFDTIFRALKLTNVESVEASSTKRMPETFPAASLVDFHFAARGQMPPVTIEWYDGELRPERPPELDESRDLSGEDNEGLLFIGDSGKILCGFNGEKPQLIPAAKMKAFRPPPDTLPRSPGHYREFILACKGGAKPAANFEFSAPVVETLLLGNIAARTGKLLHWDAANFTIRNQPEAQQYVNPPYRGTWAT